MATGWLRGKVKEVVSGDTLVLTANVKSDAPQAEKRLTLSSLIAPKLVTVSDGSSGWLCTSLMEGCGTCRANVMGPAVMSRTPGSLGNGCGTS
jgi:hypothetical protein